MAFEDLSAEELQAQLDQIAEQRLLLERALEQRHQAHKGDLVVEIRNLIAGAGYTLDEILPLVGAKAKVNPGGRRRAGGAGDGERASYTTYADPQDPASTYTRGPIPGWMKARMTEQGYDPSDKASREAFKTQYLVRAN